MDVTEPKRIDRASERDKAKAEQRKRLAEALRANLRRRKAVASGTLDAAPETPALPAGKD